MINPRIRGIDTLTIRFILSPVIDIATNIFDATGGVTKAIHKASVIITPKCTGLMPTEEATAKRMGDKIMVHGVVWINIPAINKMPNIKNRMIYGLLEISRKKPLIIF